MKNVIKKVLATAVATALVLATALTAMAASFPDVTEALYPWAVDSIESMADRGIIKGYENGDFGPAKTVSKLESLVMISRILGVNDDENETLVEAAGVVFASDIEEYDLPYGEEEVAYLMIKGVLTAEDLEDYVAEANRNDGLKRYEAAVLLTKALNAENSISSDIISTLSYSDVSDIPANAKKFVAFVESKGLMNGMEDGRFAPNETLTRAQAAVIFDRFSRMHEYSYKTGIVAYVDQTSRTIKIKESEEKMLNHTLTSDILLRFNGTLITVNDIEPGYHATLTYADNKLSAIDFTEILVDDVVYAAYAGTSTSTAKGTTITVNVIDDFDTVLDTTSKTTYRLADDCVITYQSATCSVSALKTGYFLELTIRNGEVVFVQAENKTTKISGRINEIIREVPYRIVIEAGDGEAYEYLVYDGAEFTRNGLRVSASEILAGDTVTSATLTYGRISSLTATSKSTTKTGDIVEVVISRSPRITLRINGEDVTYFVKSDASINLNDKDATFYDLRVGTTVEFKAEGDTIVSLKGVVSSEVVTITGYVTSVSTEFKYIQLRVTDPMTGATSEKLVHVKDNASILKYDSTKAQKLSAIKEGMTVTVTGSMNNGSFEAGAVIIIG